jgi:uncharacterized protein (DUF983 family)
MSRIVDKPYFTYSAYNALTSGIQVKCPKCHGAGVVTADDDNAYFRCLSCGHRMTQDRTIYRYDVHNQCKNCGRYYRVDIEDTAKQHFPVLHVARGFLLLYHWGLSHPPFWRVFLFCLRCLFRFRGVVRYALGVEQVLNLAAQCLCHLPKLVHVRAFTLPAAPAFHCAVAHASPAAKLPAAYPCGLAALVYGVIGVCFSHAAVLLLHKYTANAVKMEV